jgi:hypothetical protein
MKFLQTVYNRAYNFFIGPKLVVKFQQTHPDKWMFRFGVNVWWDSAPGFHFDNLGFELYFGPWTFYVGWVDNN